MEREEVTALYSNADPRPESLQFVSGDRIVLTRSFCSDAWWYGTTVRINQSIFFLKKKRKKES